MKQLKVKKKSESPPVLATKLLTSFTDYEMDFNIVDTLQELYCFKRDTEGKRIANLWYWKQVLHTILKFQYVELIWRFIMFNNYLKITFRKIKINKGYSFINLAGLALGLASCILIFFWVQDELSFDRYHDNADNLYRILIDKKADVNPLTSFSPSALGPDMQKDFPEIENSMRFIIRSTPPEILVRYDNEAFYETRLALTDPSIFEMFNFPFIEGDPDSALDQPDSIVITENFARKYFGNSDAIGKTMIVDNNLNLVVTGIIENVPFNSHLQFDALIQFNATSQTLMPTYGDPYRYGYYFFKTYLLLEKTVSIDAFSKKIYEYMTEREVSVRKVLLQPIKDIHLHSSDVAGNLDQGDIKYIYIFSITGILILLIACLNYINLTTAKSVQRSKEVGMRKLLGAFRMNLIKQFFTESVFFTGISLLFAFFLVWLLLPAVNELTGKELTLNITDNIATFLGIIAVAFVVGILSGTYPALVLSSFRPISVLKGALVQGKNKGRFRKVLVFAQYVIAVGLIICTFVIFFQFNYMQSYNLGFEKDQMIYIKLNGNLKEKYNIVKSEFEKNPDVLGTSVSSSLMSRHRYVTTFFSWDNMNPDIESAQRRADYVSVDRDFINMFGLEVIQGRNFSERAEFYPQSEIIINEAALKMMQVESPLGLSGDLGDRTENLRATIVGVIKDYNFRSLHTTITPQILWINPQFYTYMYIKIKTEDLQETLKYVQSVVTSIEPAFPFEYNFLDESFESLYLNEMRMSKFFRYFSTLAILLACLGLIGLMSFITETRTKEIGIRKVLGASNGDILRFVSFEFISIVIIANIFAWPVTYYFMYKWLQNFPYRIDLSVLFFLLSSLIVLLISILTLSYQSINAIRANPVESLHYE
jgi:putative ABC transport system permease protein